MYIIRETFTAKPGQASKLAKMMKEISASMPEMQARMKTKVMTDAVGDFNTVVMETEVEQFSEFEKMMKEYATRTDIHEKMKGYTDMYVTGKREIFQLV